MQLKSPSEYSRSVLEKMDISELEELKQLATDKAEELYTLQIAYKVLINSLYGALGNKAFILNNEKIAQAITGNGRYFIKSLGKNIDSELQKKIPYPEGYYKYSDTDSILGDSLVTLGDGSKLSIQELFESADTVSEVSPSGHEIRCVDDMTALCSRDGKSLESNRIIYVMRHLVSKDLYKISVLDASVICTEDHSVMAVRNGKLTEVKPQDLLSTDELVLNKGGLVRTSRFDVQKIGIKDEYVYDIEVENAHNFFANDILVHNSAYYTVEPFVEEYKKSHPNADVLELTKYCHDFEEQEITPIIQGTIDTFCRNLNALDPSACGAKMEIIADRMILVAKKKYLARIRESESSVYPANHPKTKAMGVELIKSSTAAFTRKYLQEAVQILFDGTNEDLFQWFDEIKMKFTEVPIIDIATTSSVTKLDYNLETDVVPVNSRAAMYYNQYVDKNNLTEKYTKVNPSEKIKLIHLRCPHPFADNVRNSRGRIIEPNVIAFVEEEFGEFLRDYVDFDTQFEKCFINPLKIMTEAICFNVQRPLPSLF